MKVDFEANQRDLKTALLAECGFYARTIACEAKLSVGQVTYRYRKAGISLRDYREGKSPMARMILGSAMANTRYISDLKRRIAQKLIK